ncbi:LexA/Signal peptidase [Microthyrium microscopicum]|uniref:LexA/Signal peptidase n=1 Tax=Microthyrium microscopicum TaxID=703497 RepID=A0A6A6UCT2_9PEZI|nr:LexA/Signal peptidase [Microthyrium microscopicum]
MPPRLPHLPKASPFRQFLLPRSLKIYTSSALLALAVYHTTPIYPTTGPSMLPFLPVHNGIVLYNPLTKRGRNVRVGDVVVAKSPYQGGGIVKRVVGLPGDVVCVDGDAGRERRYAKVPAGHVWVAGDNVPWSVDSRHYGPLAMGLIIGKVVAVGEDYWWNLRGLEGSDGMVRVEEGDVD